MKSGKENPAYKHGMFGTKTHKAWDGMIQRCHNPKCKDYKNWGARGIFVCHKWRKSFISFLKDMGVAPEGMSLGRLDNDGPYSKENCEWQTQKEQHRNKRNNTNLFFMGKRQPMSAWAEELGINKNTICWRLQNGWSVERALTTRP